MSENFGFPVYIQAAVRERMEFRAQEAARARLLLEAGIRGSWRRRAAAVLIRIASLLDASEPAELWNPPQKDEWTAVL